MNQFDIYLNPIKRSSSTYPFVCTLQHNLYEDLSSQVVAFVCNDESLALDKLSVAILIDAKPYFICLNVVATLDVHRLEKLVGNVTSQRDQILSAYDALFTGI